MHTNSLTRFAWLSIAAALITIILKGLAYYVTGSVGLLSDALESGVNLVAAIFALGALTVAAMPPDTEHQYGHGKVEYFSSGLEGALIMFAAGSIAMTAWQRLQHPQEIEQLGFGVAVSIIASLVNFGVARVLLQAGRHYHSITLEADSHHLMTDVWTSVGVVVGVGAAGLTGLDWIDPVVALAVAVNIIWSGVQLVRRSAMGLLDTALPETEITTVKDILAGYMRESGVQYHALRTRQAGARRFVSVHILVPGWWTVHEGHGLLERIEMDIRAALWNVTVFTHLEALDDPASWQDINLDRPDARPEKEPVSES